MSLAVAVRHRFGKTGFALDAAFVASSPGVTVLFGPSGSGKSCVINVVAGLLRADGASITLDGERLDRLPAERRRASLVFQDSRLFPHLGVRANLLYGFRRAPRGAIGFDEVVSLLGIEALVDRPVQGLSGGERQRVAIGRALLAQPRLLLMDEPLAALDRARRDEILPYISRLKSRLSLPILYVTHASDELARLADTIVLMRDGRAIASGPVETLLSRPDLPLARADDAASLLIGRVLRHDQGRRLTAIACGGTVLLVPLCQASPGTPARLRVPARDVALATIAPQQTSFQNALPARVREMLVIEGEHTTLLSLDVEPDEGVPFGETPARLLSRVTQDAVERLGLATGSGVLILLKSTAIEVLIDAANR